MIGAWPNNYSEQVSWMLQFENRLQKLEEKSIVATIYSETRPTQENVTIAWQSFQTNSEALPTEGCRVLWLQASTNSLKGVYLYSAGAFRLTNQVPAKQPSKVLFHTAVTSPVAAVATGELPSGYTEYYVVYNVRSTQAALVTDFLVDFNGTTTASYSQVFRYYDNARSTYERLNTRINIAQGVPGATSNASYWGSGSFTVENVTSTLTNKTFTGQAYSIWGATVGAGTQVAQRFNGTWRNVTPLTNLTFRAGAGNIDAGSFFTVFGLHPV